MLNNKQINIDRKYAEKVGEEFGDIEDVSVMSEALSKILIEEQLGVSVETGDDPPDLKFSYANRLIGVEVTCVYEHVNLIKNNRQVDSQRVQNVLRGIAEGVIKKLINDDSVTLPSDVYFWINTPFPNDIEFGKIKTWDAFRKEKKEITTKLLNELKNYFENIPSNPYDPYFRNLDIVTGKGVSIPFEINGSSLISPEEGEMIGIDELKSGGFMGNFEIRKSLKERITDKANKDYGQQYDELWLLIFDRWQESNNMAGLGSVSIYGISKKEDKEIREIKIALQEEFSEDAIGHPFSKVAVFNTLGNRSKPQNVHINPLIIYDRYEDIFDPRVFWDESKLLEISPKDLKRIISKEKYKGIKIQEHLEIIGSRLVSILKEREIDLPSLKKLNDSACGVLRRLEDFSDEDNFTSHIIDLAGLVTDAPMVRWDICNFGLFSASRWRELAKKGWTELKKDFYLNLFSDTLRQGSKSRRISLLRYLESFDFLYQFDKTWSEDNLIPYFNKKFGWKCYLSRHIHGTFIPNVLKDHFLDIAENLNIKSKFGKIYIRSFVFNICYNTKGYRDPAEWIAALFRKNDSESVRMVFCKKVDHCLSAMEHRGHTSEIESCWNQWLRKYCTERISQGSVDESRCLNEIWGRLSHREKSGK